MSDIDLEEIEIVSFQTAERKPEEAEVEMVEVRCGRRGVERRAVRCGALEYECMLQAVHAIRSGDGRATRLITLCMRDRAAGSCGGGAQPRPSA